MTNQQSELLERCVEALWSRLPWIETIDAVFDGPLLRLEVAHSYPSDVRADIRRIVRRAANRVQRGARIEVEVMRVAAGYAEALRAAQQIAEAGRTEPKRYHRFWN